MVVAQKALADGGVVPSHHVHYSSQQMVAAIKEGIGAEPLIHCNRGKLTEVRRTSCDARTAE